MKFRYVDIKIKKKPNNKVKKNKILSHNIIKQYPL